MDVKALKEEIERVRKQMYKQYLANPNGKEIIQVSQQLDRLLNEYRLKKDQLK